MSYLGGMDHDERGMLHDLIHTFVQKLNVERRLNEDLVRQLDAANARLKLLEATHYGLI
jgi:hypothetical protein